MAFTIPRRNASWASMISPVKMSSHALAMPTRRGRKYVPPQSGCSPRLTNACVNFAAVEARRMSQPSARFIPAPAAAPFTAAITGLGASRIASSTRSRSGATLSSSGRAGARHDQHANLGILTGPEDGVVEIVAQRIAQRVQALGAVQGERGDGVLHFVDQALVVGHGPLL